MEDREQVVMTLKNRQIDESLQNISYDENEDMMRNKIRRILEIDNNNDIVRTLKENRIKEGNMRRMNEKDIKMAINNILEISTTEEFTEI